jgi:glycosyltransferase involved in cell wall biosynthesis
MRILFLAPFIPSSERPDALHHLRLLSKDHKVTLVVLFSQEAELTGLEFIRNWAREIYPLKLPKFESFKSCGLRLFTRWPLYLAYYFSPAIAQEICKIARERDFDLVHAHTLRMAAYAVLLDSIPQVCNIQDVLTARYLGYVKQGSVSLSRILDMEEWLKLKRFEPWLCAQLKIIGVVSEEEGQLLQELAPEVRVHVLRPGVDPSYFEPFPDSKREKTIVFLGRLGYRPNVESALRIANSIFPRIRQQIPEARLIIVGSDPPGRVLALRAREGITVTGRVPDVRPYLGRAAVSLCPVSTGGGVKIKILQSLAMATSVVTNTFGATGLGLTPGENFLLAEDDESLGAACSALLSNPAHWRRIGNAGREHVIRRHSWDRIAESIEAFHNLR